ncbi:hypothetical protein ACHAWC_006305 [Mediolabrus comicus]
MSRSSANKKTAPHRAGTRKSARAKTTAVNNKNNNSSSTGKRKGNKKHDPFENTRLRKKQRSNKENKLEIAQILIDLAENPGLKIIKVREPLIKDKKGRKWPVIVMSHATKILEAMKKINSSLKLDNYGWNYVEGKEGSDEAKLKAILRKCGFWTVKSPSLRLCEAPPRGGEWKHAVAHPHLEADDYVDGKFNEEKVAQINTSWPREYEKKPNPFQDNKKKPEVKQASIKWRGKMIALQSNLTAKEAKKLKERAKKVCIEMEGENSAVTREEIVKVLVERRIKSGVPRYGWVAGTKSKKAPKTKKARGEGEESTRKMWKETEEDALVGLMRSEAKKGGKHLPRKKIVEDFRSDPNHSRRWTEKQVEGKIASIQKKDWKKDGDEKKKGNKK